MSDAVEMAVVEGLEEASGEAQVGEETYFQLVNAAVRVGYHPNYLGKLANEGQLTAVRDTRNRIWVSQSALDAFVTAREEAKQARAQGVKVRRSGSNYVPQRVRSMKAAIVELDNATDEDLPQAVREAAREFFSRRFQEERADWVARQEEKETATEAAETDEEFQEELSS